MSIPTKGGEPHLARLPLGTYGRAGVALALAWVAGFVDGVGYLTLLGIYTSHMTGNTAALALPLDHARWHQVLEHGWPILAFVLGLVTGAVLTEAGRRWRFHSRLSLVLGIEILLLVWLLAAAPVGASVSIAWLGLPAWAMGMQTVTVTRVGDQRVYTTYVTGNLAKFGEAVTGYFFWLADSSRARRQIHPRPHGWLRQAVRHRLLGHALLTGGLWLLFLAGALSGAWAELAWELRAFWCPIAALALLIALDLRRPIAPVGVKEPIGFEI